MTSHLLQRGIGLWQEGRRLPARKIFEAILYNDRTNESAWRWYIYTRETDKEKIAALETYLSIAPGNEKARLALEVLRALPEEEGKVEERAAPGPAIQQEIVEEAPPRQAAPAVAYLEDYGQPGPQVLTRLVLVLAILAPGIAILITRPRESFVILSIALFLLFLASKEQRVMDRLRLLQWRLEKRGGFYQGHYRV